jgi:hypothetical protein
MIVQNHPLSVAMSAKLDAICPAGPSSLRPGNYCSADPQAVLDAIKESAVTPLAGGEIDLVVA